MMSNSRFWPLDGFLFKARVGRQLSTLEIGNASRLHENLRRLSESLKEFLRMELLKMLT
jgi:hypothetical protein